MADMDTFEFAAMIEETPVRTRVVEYADASGTLVATCLTDILDDGVSMVYSFFEPDRPKASLGTYVILDHVEIARENGLPYVYLGYWVRAYAHPPVTDSISEQVANISLPDTRPRG
jgi:arginine-tRNA-protein transferase